MPITAYASGDPNPIVNHVHPTLDLSVVVLPQNVALYGDAVDSGDPEPAFTWEWRLLQKPAGSTAALDDATLQNPTLVGVDVWGNYLLLLVAHNEALASQENPLLAPSVSLVTVRCQSERLGLEKPAPGERDWHDRLHEVIEAVEDGTVGPHDIADHGDVAAATGADLDVLVSQGLADDPDAPGTDLHTHSGVAVTRATVALPGVVELAEAPLDGGHPKCVTRDKFRYTAQCVAGEVIGVWTLGILPATTFLAHFHAYDEITVIRLGLVFRNAPAAGDYTFELRVWNIAVGSVVAPGTQILETTFTGNGTKWIHVVTLSEPYLVAAGSHLLTVKFLTGADLGPVDVVLDVERRY